MKNGGSRPPRSLLRGLAAGALAAVAVAAWLGSREFVGTFGATGQPMTCGSVWGLLTAADLNAASCKPDLLNRLTLVAALLGASGLAIAAALTSRHRQAHPSSTGNRALVVAVVLVPLLLSVVVVAVGRHLAWSVSGA